MEDSTEIGKIWESLQLILTNPCEQRVAYLLFHCGLKPREIIHFCPQEWSDVQEISLLKHDGATCQRAEWYLRYISCKSGKSIRRATGKSHFPAELQK